MSTPTRTAVVGGHGQIARLLLPLLAARGDRPVALVRDPAYAAELEPLGATVRILDLERATIEEYAAALDGCDAVVFAAGGGGDGSVERKRTVDLGGSLKSAAAAADLGIDRFVQISAMGVDRDPPSDSAAAWTAYVEAKRDADTALRATGLAWTIVRPGRLTDDPATDRVLVGPELESGSVSRADAAAVIAAVLADDALVGVQFDLTEGTMPIAEAVESLRV